MNRQEFLDSIKMGKWFVVDGKHNDKFLIKLKSTGTTINALWLSHFDTETMALQDYSYDRKQWDIVDGNFTIFGSDTYQFGSFDPGDDSIYDEELNLLEDKMVSVILYNAPSNFLEKEELQIAWNHLKQKKLEMYETLLVS